MQICEVDRVADLQRRLRLLEDEKRALHEEKQALAQENEKLREKLEARKTIERARGVLMKRYRWNEDQAFRAIQKTAMDMRIPAVQVAKKILNGEKIALSV